MVAHLGHVSLEYLTGGVEFDEAAINDIKDRPIIAFRLEPDGVLIGRGRIVVGRRS